MASPEQLNELSQLVKNLGEMIEALAKAKGIISEEQGISISVRLNTSGSSSNVQDAKHEILRMSINEFFTEERFRSAGQPTPVYRHNILKALNDNSLRISAAISALNIKVITVENLLLLPKRFYLDIIGPRTYEVMRKVFASEGLHLT